MDDDIIIYYKSLHPSIPGNMVIGDNNDGSFSLRPMYDSIPSTMTLIQNFDGKIFDLKCLFYILSCLPSERDCTKMDGPVISSVRYGDLVKGNPRKKKRKNKKKTFPSSITIDVWGGKHKGVEKGINMCFKVSSIFHITGARLDRMTNMSCDYVLSAINDGLDFFDDCNRDKEYFLDMCEWLEDNSKGRMVEIDDKRDYTISWPAYVPRDDRNMIFSIMDRFGDLKYVSEIMIRAKSILRSEYPCSDLYLTKMYRSLINYNYDLGVCIERGQLESKLKQLNYNVNFHNTGKYDVVVTIVDRNKYPDDVYMQRKGEKRYETKINITMKGKVKLSGGGGMRMENAYKKFFSDIIHICNEDVIEDNEVEELCPAAPRYLDNELCPAAPRYLDSGEIENENRYNKNDSDEDDYCRCNSNNWLRVGSYDSESDDY